MIRFQCPKCGTTLRVNDQHAGKRGHCTKCDATFVIPAASTEAEPANGAPETPMEPDPVSDPLAALAAASNRGSAPAPRTPARAAPSASRPAPEPALEQPAEPSPSPLAALSSAKPKPISYASPGTDIPEYRWLRIAAVIFYVVGGLYELVGIGFFVVTLIGAVMSFSTGAMASPRMGGGMPMAAGAASGIMLLVMGFFYLLIFTVGAFMIASFGFLFNAVRDAARNSWIMVANTSR